jgi:ABC-type transport system substrate-binding protein
MQGTLYVEWAWNDDRTRDRTRPDYWGYGTIDGKRVKIYGDIEETRDGVRRARLIIRESADQG